MSWGALGWRNLSRRNIGGGLGDRSGGGSDSSSSDPGLRSSGGQLLHHPLVFNPHNPNSVRVVLGLPSQLRDHLGVPRGLFPQLLDHGN